MRLDIRSTATYELPAETFLALMIEPSLEGPGHRVLRENLVTSTTSFSELNRDLYDNPRRHLIVPPGTFSFEFAATIDAVPNTDVPRDAIQHPPREIPAEAMVYTLPSRYCQSDLLARMARDEFGHHPTGGERVYAIAKWVRRHVEYRYGTTDSLTSAFDTATERIGVCRDFAHLVIAFCRALDIPARYVSGYALGLEPPDFHGYAQAYLGAGWHNVDATFEGVRPALVPIAIGRDAADVPMLTFWGRSRLVEQAVHVREAPRTPPPPIRKPTPPIRNDPDPRSPLDP
jgi:transglutaminase-like putative cysteine protease